MRNLLYLNADCMVNCHPEKDTMQINDDYYCEMNEAELCDYTTKHNLYISNGELLDREDGYLFGVVLTR